MDPLLGLLKKHSYREGRVTLASGRESDFFIDCKQTVLLAEGHARIGAAMLAKVAELPERPRAVAGVVLGGCPLASAVALASFEKAAPLDAIYVRKEAKDHGSKRLVEGSAHLPAESPVVVLEDVVTTGGSTLAAVEVLRAERLRVVAVIALVDREEGGAEAIAAAGIPFFSIFRKRDFLGGA